MARGNLIAGRLSRAFDVRPGEGLATLLLLAYSLANGVFVALFFSFANATFLAHFEIRFLPYAYIAAGAVGYLAVGLFSRLGRRHPLTRLLPGAVLAVLALAVVFRLGFALTDSKWLSFAIFIWTDPILTLLDLGFWTLAGNLFNLQQGKRLFGLVSSGGTVSEIIGFFLVPVALGYLDDSSDLLVGAAVGLAAGALVMIATVRRFSHRLGPAEGAAAEPERTGTVGVAGTGSRPRPAAAPRRDRYTLLVSLVAVLVVFTLYFVDFSFLSQIRVQFSGEVALAGFLGWFWCVTKAIELGFKTFLSGRLLGQFGTILGLMSLPVAVLVCMAGAAASLRVAGIGLVFFALVALAKMVEFTVRRALFDPSFKVLFQPLPLTRRFAVQTRVEGGVKQIALGLAGLALALISLSPALGLADVIHLTVFLILAWVAVNLLTYREYRARLMGTLSSLTRKAIVPSAAEVLRRDLREAGPRKVGYALNVLENVDQGLLEETAVELLGRPEAAVRRTALARIAALRLVAAREAVADRAAGDPDPAVRRAAEETLAAVREADGAAYTPDRLALLGASGRVEDRLLAATVLARGRGTAPRETLGDLLWDPDPAVHRLALMAAGRDGDPEHWPRLIQRLPAGLFCKEASAALAAIGEPVLRALEMESGQFDQQPEVLLRILRIYERIGGPEAERLLFARINYPSRDVQAQALYSLSVLGYRAREEEAPAVKRQIEELVDRITWYVAARRDVGDGEAVVHLAAALERETDKDLAALFLMLALIADTQAVKVLQDSFAEGSDEARTFALEVAEVVVPPELRPLLLPILEQPAPSELLERLDLEFPQQRLGRPERLKEILRQGSARINAWTRAAALRALLDRGPGEVSDEMVANLFHSDPMVREMAAWAIFERDPGAFETHLGKLKETAAFALDEAIRPGTGVVEERGRPLLIYEKVLLLKAAPIFAGIPKPVLARLAPEAREVWLAAGELLFAAGDPGTQLFVVVTGRLEVEADGAVLGQVGEAEVLGEMAAVETGVRTASVRAVEESRLLRIEQAALFNLMADRMEVIPKVIRVIVERREQGVATDTAVGV